MLLLYGSNTTGKRVYEYTPVAWLLEKLPVIKGQARSKNGQASASQLLQADIFFEVGTRSSSRGLHLCNRNKKGKYLIV
jgi:hypothetical protein